MINKSVSSVSLDLGTWEQDTDYWVMLWRQKGGNYFSWRSHLWDGPNTNTVDERTLEHLAFLQERYTEEAEKLMKTSGLQCVFSVIFANTSNT